MVVLEPFKLILLLPYQNNDTAAQFVLTTHSSGRHISDTECCGTHCSASGTCFTTKSHVKDATKCSRDLSHKGHFSIAYKGPGLKLHMELQSMT